MTPASTIAALAAELAMLGPELGLDEEALTPEYARREGSWNGRPLALHTRVFAGGGATFRVAAIEGDSDAVASVTVIGICGDVVLGIDVVTFADRFVTFIADLRNMDGPEPLERLERLHDATLAIRRMSAAASSVPSDAPFGPALLWVKPEPDAALEVAAVTRAYSRAFARVLETSTATGPNRESVTRYLRWLAHSKKQLKVLGRLFGEAWVERYFDVVFLSPPAPSSEVAA